MQETTQFPNRLTTSFVKRFCPNPCAMYDLVALYDEFNFTFFDGELPALNTYAVERDGEVYIETKDIVWSKQYKRVYGKYFYKSRKIKLATFMAHSPSLVKGTLLHEMVHKYLDLKGLDDGVEGHGENFINEAVRVNKLVNELDMNCWVKFQDVIIRREEPVFQAQLIGREVVMVKDLDLVAKMTATLRAGFDRKWTQRL